MCAQRRCDTQHADHWCVERNQPPLPLDRHYTAQNVSAPIDTVGLAHLVSLNYQSPSTTDAATTHHSVGEQVPALRTAEHHIADARCPGAERPYGDLVAIPKEGPHAQPTRDKTNGYPAFEKLFADGGKSL